MKEIDRTEIYDGTNATRKFLAYTIPSKTTPAKSLESIKAFGEHIILHYRKPYGNRISKDKVIEIMQYLDTLSR